MAEAVAVFDVGKSSAKLALVDRKTYAVLTMRTTPNVVLRDGPYPHFDVDRLFEWLVDGLSEFADQAHIGVISVTAHGACFAVASGDKLALPILDYEHPGPEEVDGEYRSLRGDFCETLSPELPAGLNVGRQIFWLSRRFREAFATIDAILPYPQYWVWRLTGQKVSEITSFGAHTDLRDMRNNRFSRLAEGQGWAPLFPHFVRAWDTVGAPLPAIMRETGLPADCRVVAGIHDSNAGLLPHLLRRALPFTVASTGTWVITLAPGGSLEHLDSRRGCLANIDAYGRPVPATMWMGGREIDTLTGGAPAEPGATEIAKVIKHQVMALPAFVAGSGPFGKRHGSWTVAPEELTPGERTAVASLYSALVEATCLSLTGSAGPVIVEGPFGRNRLFLAALAQLTGRPVVSRPDATGTTVGAALLADGPDRPRPDEPEAEPVAPLDLDLASYAATWRERAVHQD